MTVAVTGDDRPILGKIMQADDMNDKPWRIMKNEYNLRAAPWDGAIGIEEVNDALAVPGIVCWFTRAWDSERAARQMVEMHNASHAGQGSR